MHGLSELYLLADIGVQTSMLPLAAEGSEHANG